MPEWSEWCSQLEVDSIERIGWLADFAAQIQDLPDGTSVRIRITQ